MTPATLKMDPVNPEKNATTDGTNRKRKEASPDQGTTRLPAEAVEACAVKVCIFILNSNILRREIGCVLIIQQKF